MVFIELMAVLVIKVIGFDLREEERRDGYIALFWQLGLMFVK